MICGKIYIGKILMVGHAASILHPAFWAHGRTPISLLIFVVTQSYVQLVQTVVFFTVILILQIHSAHGMMNMGPTMQINLMEGLS